MGKLLTSVSIAALFGVGIGAAFAPEALASNYGLPIEPGDASGRGLVRALGARDATIGAIALAFALADDQASVRRVLGISTLLAVADFSIVLGTQGFKAWTSLAIHGSGIAGLLLAAATD